MWQLTFRYAALFLISAQACDSEKARPPSPEPSGRTMVSDTCPSTDNANTEPPSTEDIGGSPAGDGAGVESAGTGGNESAGTGGNAASAPGAAGNPAPAAQADTCSQVDSKVLLVPYIAGAYTRVYTPRNQRYLNDHTVVRGRDDRWHVIGITNTGVGDPNAERSFLHATAASLFGAWEEQPDVLMAAEDERIIWAPHIMRTENVWTMFYYSEPLQQNARFQRLRRVQSENLSSWERINDVAGPPGGRDPYTFKDGDHWLLYSVGVRDSHGQILVSSTAGSELKDWGRPTAVIEDPMPSFGWGNLESPTVIHVAGYYYLFLTRTRQEAPTDYNLTLVFRSEDPLVFKWEPIAELRAHAAEIIRDGDEYLITSCGWPSSVGEANRGLSIARLQWARQ